MSLATPTHNCFLLCSLLLQKESESHTVVSDSLRPHGLHNPWNSPGQNTGVGSLSLLQGIFPTQEWNRGLLQCRRILYQLSYQGSYCKWSPNKILPEFLARPLINFYWLKSPRTPGGNKGSMAQVWWHEHLTAKLGSDPCYLALVKFLSFLI